MQELDRIRRNWEQFGRQSPLAAILNDPNRGGAWQLDEFFESGRTDVSGQLAYLATLGVQVNPGRALDFGCGVGRLTQALGETFAECDGVDVAASMIDLARQYNRLGERCRYHVNPNSDLSIFGDGQFDFVLSIIVLQHIPPDISLGYVREFIRLLKPGGVALFQAPSAVRGTPARLAPEECGAEVTPLRTPARLRGGERAEATVRVRNGGSLTWRRGMRLKLANRWRRGPELVVMQDGRAEFLAEVAPGVTVELQLAITAPTRPGSYQLELGLLQEGLDWIVDPGLVATVPVSVRPSAKLAGALARRLPGSQIVERLRGKGSDAVMDMYCLPKVDVVAAIEAGGARVVDVSDMDVCGDGFESLRYVAVR